MFIENKLYYKSYDPDTTIRYGRLGGPGGLPVPGKWGVQTAGASTTITASSGTPFAPLEGKVGSILVFTEPRPDTKLVRRLVTWTSPTQIVVDTAITLPVGTGWFWYPFKVGTTDNDGWHLVNDLSAITVYVDVETLGSTSVNVTIQAGGGPFSTPVTLSTTNVAAAGETAIAVTQVVQSLRVGLSVVGGPAVDAVTVWVKGQQLQTGL